MLQQVFNLFLSLSGLVLGSLCISTNPPLPPSFTFPVLPSPRGGWFVVYLGVWPGGWGSSASGGHLCVDGVCEAHVERVIVLHQGGLVVVEHQVLQAAVQVVGLSEAEAARCAVDDAVLHFTFNAEDTQRRQSIKLASQGFRC